MKQKKKYNSINIACQIDRERNCHLWKNGKFASFPSPYFKKEI